MIAKLFILMPPLQTADERMIELMFLLKSMKIVRSQSMFCRLIGCERSRFNKIRAGSHHFIGSHIEAACREYNVNANWIFGVERNVFRGENNTRQVNKFLMELGRSSLKVSA